MNKGHILEEIRRTAAENQGAPLGAQRFSAVTGVRESDWSKYSVRWGDALKEAGFSPNSLQSAYDDEFLLEKLALLTRELGHFPVQREIGMKARHDSFPSKTTFDRFGGKSQLAARLEHFCRQKSGFEDVAAMCEPLARPETSIDSSQRLPETEEVMGFVYLLKSGRYWKIGRSNAVGRRERELAIQLPEKSKVVHSIKTDDPCGIEAYWHTRFKDRHKNGEWFELTAEDVAAFKRRRFM